MPDPIDCLRDLDARCAVYEGAARDRIWSFRERVRGEMLGDIELIRSTVAPTFSYVAHTAGAQPRIIAPGRAETDLFNPLCATEDLVIWLTMDHFVADERGVAGDGLLHISCPAQAAPRYGIDPTDDPDAFYVVSSEIALFVRYEDRLMTQEVTYSDPATRSVSAVAEDTAIRRESLRERIDRELPAQPVWGE